MSKALQHIDNEIGALTRELERERRLGFEYMGTIRTRSPPGVNQLADAIRAIHRASENQSLRNTAYSIWFANWIEDARMIHFNEDGAVYQDTTPNHIRRELQDEQLLMRVAERYKNFIILITDRMINAETDVDVIGDAHLAMIAAFKTFTMCRPRTATSFCALLCSATGVLQPLLPHVMREYNSFVTQLATFLQNVDSAPQQTTP